MKRKLGVTPTQATEDDELTDLLDSIAPREPLIRIYRLDDRGKQTFLGSADLDSFDLEEVRNRFGGGRFLLRSVRANGTYGPSRVVSIAERIQERRQR